MVEGDGALWRAEEIARERAVRPDKLDRLVVAIDPPAGLEGSACGIIVAGRRGKHGYVLADRWPWACGRWRGRHWLPRRRANSAR